MVRAAIWFGHYLHPFVSGKVYECWRLRPKLCVPLESGVMSKSW
jgi:hypothetical protein